MESFNDEIFEEQVVDIDQGLEEENASIEMSLQSCIEYYTARYLPVSVTFIVVM
jgi:hypothetical protein